MKILKQNDRKLNKDINKIGCFFISCLYVAQYHENKALTAPQIEQLWQWAKCEGYINANNDITQSAPIINQALKLLGNTKTYFYEAAIFKEGNLNWYPSISSEDRHLDAHIQKIKTKKLNTHFRYIDKYGKVIDDPYKPAPQAIAIYYTICYGKKQRSN